MENATKALLIAAAVLIAIVLISLGVYVVGIGQQQIEQSGNALSDLEIQQFNSKFDSYAGTSVSGSKVKTLVDTVYNHNLSESDDSRKVSINGDISLATDATSKPSVGTGYRYTVVMNQDTTSALITSITITQNT